MRKPENYDTAIPINTGEFTQVPPGGYIMRIVNVEIKKTKTGKEMMVLNLDIAEGEYANYFTDRFLEDSKNNPVSNWKCRYYQLTSGSSVGFFKGMIKSIEKSNDGYLFDFDESKLTWKLVGGLLQKEKYIDLNGAARVEKTTTKCVALRAVQTIKDGKFTLPEPSDAPIKKPKDDFVLVPGDFPF